MITQYIHGRANRMKECWINVYDVDRNVWYGARYLSRTRAMLGVGKLKKRLLYRIHVRLK